MFRCETESNQIGADQYSYARASRNILALTKKKQNKNQDRFHASRLKSKMNLYVSDMWANLLYTIPKSKGIGARLERRVDPRQQILLKRRLHEVRGWNTQTDEALVWF